MLAVEMEISVHEIGAFSAAQLAMVKKKGHPNSCWNNTPVACHPNYQKAFQDVKWPILYFRLLLLQIHSEATKDVVSRSSWQSTVQGNWTQWGTLTLSVCHPSIITLPQQVKTLFIVGAGPFYWEPLISLSYSKFTFTQHMWPSWEYSPFYELAFKLCKWDRRRTGERWREKRTEEA